MSIAATGQGAVAPGTDLFVHAHELRMVHDAVLSGSRPPAGARDLVVRSWRRVMASGLDAGQRNPRDPLPMAETERRRESSPIALVIDELCHVLTSVADASSFLRVVTDADGVAHHAGLARRDRIQAPRAEHALAVPGLGWCVPERLGEGRLVRPASSARRLTARLDVRTGMLSVRTADGAWQAALSRRHAELLRLVTAAGPEGIAAATLSPAVYGDADHVVTVRAQMSRLRRAVGALVAAHPSRVAVDVDLVVEEPDA